MNRLIILIVALVVTLVAADDASSLRASPAVEGRILTETLVSGHAAAAALTAQLTNTADVHVSSGWALSSSHLSADCSGPAVEYTGTKLGVCTAMPAVGPDEDGNEQPSIEVMTDYAPDMGTKTYFNKQCKITMDQSPQFQLLDYSFDHEACAIPLPDWEPAPEDEAGLCNANSNGYQEAVKWYCTADDSTINSLRGINTATFKGSVCDATKSEIIGMSLKPAFTCMPDTVTGKDESFSYTSCRAAADGSNKLIVGYDMYDGKLCYGQAKDSGEVEMDAECTNNGDGTMEGVVCQGF